MNDDRAALVGKRLTLLLMAKTESGEDDWAVFPGTVVLEDGVLYLDRGVGKARLEIRAEWVERIRPVGEEISAILKEADCYLPLTVGALPPDEDGFLTTGLQWPE
jgi:hypothetical protein